MRAVSRNYSKSELLRHLNTKPSFEQFLKNVINNPRVTNCGACNNNIYFSPENYIYNCHERVNNQAFSIGYFDGVNISFNDHYNQWNNRLIHKLDNCKLCSLSLVHGGGCGARMANDQSLTHLGDCSTFPQNFDEYVRLLYEVDRKK
jgi:radical SAM protein with 4Fe4S-binding SPASM domain